MKHSITSCATSMPIVCIAGILFAAAAIAVLYSVKNSERDEKQAIQSGGAATSENDWVEKWGDDYVKSELDNLGNDLCDECQTFRRRFRAIGDSSKKHRLYEEFMTRYLAYDIAPTSDVSWETKVREYAETMRAFVFAMKKSGFTDSERIDFLFKALKAYRRNCFAPLPDLKKMDYLTWYAWDHRATRMRHRPESAPKYYVMVALNGDLADISGELKKEVLKRFDEFEAETMVQVTNEINKLNEFYIYWPMCSKIRPYRFYRGKKYDYDDVELTKEIE